MRKKTKRYIKRAAIAFAALLVILVVGYFAFRNAVLRKVIEKAQVKIESEYNATLSIGNAGFRGMGGVDMKDVLLVPKDADTLFRMETISADVDLMHLFLGRLQVEQMQVSNGFIRMVKTGDKRNFDAFLKSKKDTTVVVKSDNKKDYARRAYKMMSRVLNLIPTDLKLKNVSLEVNDNGKKALVRLDNMTLVDKELETSITVTTNTFSQRWKISGKADSRGKQADLRFFNIDSGAIKLPYLDERYNLKAGFDSIRVNLKNLDMDGSEFHVDGFASVSRLVINHPKVAPKDVVVNTARFDYNFLFGPDFIRIDSSSVATLNKIKVKPFVEYNIASDTIYTLKVGMPDTKAQDFIESLPEGLFSNFEGMQAEGSFDYHLDFQYNKAKPNALVFNSTLNRRNLKIIKYGEADLDKLNRQFVYRAIENGRPQRPVVVGSANPNFVPIEQISPLLRHAVLTSEDPSFFRHKGFINEAFKQSIIRNIKTKKFARGASTISMQLVKNVFLTREKTLSRKLEEILMVYVLENNRIVSKERMFEVYLNIIEWGPNVYGIGEASRFYFQKHPSELTLKECLFLASIIPSPKKFMYQFNDDGELRSPYQRHQDRLTRLMFQRGLLKPEDTAYQLRKLLISGPASRYVKIRTAEDVIAPDPEMDEFDF